MRMRADEQRKREGQSQEEEALVLEEGREEVVLPVHHPTPVQQLRRQCENIQRLNESDDDFDSPGRVPRPPTPPTAGSFPTFLHGPLAIMEKNANNLSSFLRKILRVFHPKTSGSLGTGRHRWWSVPVPTRLLTSSISLGLVGGGWTSSPP